MFSSEIIAIWKLFPLNSLKPTSGLNAWIHFMTFYVFSLIILLIWWHTSAAAQKWRINVNLGPNHLLNSRNIKRYANMQCLKAIKNTNLNIQKQIFDHKILLSKAPGMVSDNQKSDQHLMTKGSGSLLTQFDSYIHYFHIISSHFVFLHCGPTLKSFFKKSS